MACTHLRSVLDALAKHADHNLPYLRTEVRGDGVVLAPDHLHDARATQRHSSAHTHAAEGTAYGKPPLCETDCRW